MSCQNCKSKRILHVTGKTSDLCHVTYNNKEIDGYVPYNLNIGGGDYIRLELCVDCGKLQGRFPISNETLEEVFGERE